MSRKSNKDEKIEKKYKDEKLNAKIKSAFVIFLISGLLALYVILNKGVIFGKRLVTVSNTDSVEVIHSIQLLASSSILSVDDGTTDVMVTVDGVDVSGGYELISSDVTIATVSGNTITAVSEGTVVITAKSTEFGVESEVTIEVVKPITKLTLESEFKIIEIGEESALSYKTMPNDNTAKVEIEYSSSDESIATVNESGIVTGVNYGKAILTATDKVSGKTSTFEITVKDI